MYFDEGRNLKDPQYKKSETHHVINSAEPTGHDAPGRNGNEGVASRPARQGPVQWQVGKVLDVANNKLQELLQLLYLLGRDPAVPKDARHHVTVAQSEIALLSRLMQNTASAEAQGPKPPVAAAGCSG